MVVERMAIKAESTQERLHGDLKVEVQGKCLTFKQGRDASNVGLQIWEAGLVLGKYLEALVARGELDLRGKTVVELGAGTGITGIMCAAMGAKVVISDLDGPVTDLMRQNAALNEGLCSEGELAVMPLDFNSCEQAASVVDYFSGTPVDLVLAADVMYVEEIIQPLLQTMNYLCAENTRMFVCFGFYRLSPLLDFFMSAREHFSVSEVPSTELDPDFASDALSVKVLTPCQRNAPRKDWSDDLRNFRELRKRKARLLQHLCKLEFKCSELIETTCPLTMKSWNQMQSTFTEKASVLEQIGKLEWEAYMELANFQPN